MLARRVDDIHGEVARIFRAFGFSVQDTSRVGGGFPDYVIGFRGKNYLVEVKNDTGFGWKYTAAQKKFNESWNGQHITITSPAEAADFAKQMRHEDR